VTFVNVKSLVCASVMASSLIPVSPVHFSDRARIASAEYPAFSWVDARNRVEFRLRRFSFYRLIEAVFQRAAQRAKPPRRQFASAAIPAALADAADRI